MTKPTMEDVARAAGLSRALVSLVMRGSDKVSDTSRERVLTAAAELGYRPNLAARHLASKRSLTIGLVLNDLHNPFFPEVADGVHAAATEAGYRVLINSGYLRGALEREAVESFIYLGVDGVLLAGARIGASDLEQLAARVPVTVIGRHLRSTSVDTVNNDDLAGGRLATEHLIELGHQRIVHIDGGQGAGSSQRRSGYSAAMRDHGLEPEVISAQFTEEAGLRAGRRLAGRPKPPEAIFVANDLAAVGVLGALADHGLRVPDDLSVVGYDNTSLAGIHHISLTSVDQDRHNMGRLAVEVLLERIGGGRRGAVHHVIAPSLVRRATSAPR